MDITNQQWLNAHDLEVTIVSIFLEISEQFNLGVTLHLVAHRKKVTFFFFGASSIKQQDVFVKDERSWQQQSPNWLF